MKVKLHEEKLKKVFIRAMNFTVYEKTLKDIKTDVTGNFPVTISQGEGGEISVNKIECLNNKTLVHYIYK